MIFRSILAAFAVAAVSFCPLRAADSESMAEHTLRQIVDRQKQLFADAEKQGDRLDEDAFHAQAQSLAHEYDRLLAANQNFAAGYASYGYFLGKVGMRKEGVAILLKANQLDPNIPFVKNQIGNYLAEEGKPIDAAQYFLAAIKLAPNEPLYHYQLGTLLTEGRDTFLKSGEWNRPALDKAMHEAFRRAAELAPDRFEFSYRYAESFYDLENPDWNDALKTWQVLETKAQSPIEQQTMKLHEANAYLKLGKPDQAKPLLDAVTIADLQGQKQKLVVQLEPAKK